MLFHIVILPCVFLMFSFYRGRGSCKLRAVLLTPVSQFDVGGRNSSCGSRFLVIYLGVVEVVHIGNS